MSISSVRPKNLNEARAIIQELKSRLGLRSSDVAASAQTSIARPAAALHPQLNQQPLNIGIDLASLTPKQLGAFFENSTTSDLRACLATETSKSRKFQNSAVVASLYREIRNRSRR